MKLLSTLFTALALIASVVSAPKAMAQDYDIEIIGTELSSDLYFDGYDWYIDFTDNNYSVYLDIMNENLFGDHYVSELYWDGSSYSSHISKNSVWFDFVNNDDKFTITDLGNGMWEIDGTATIAEYDDENYTYKTSKKVHFSYRSASASTSDEVEITDALYATYYNSSNAVQLPEGVVAYVAHVANDNKCIFQKEFDENRNIPAGVPVVLKAESADFYTLQYAEADEYDNSTNFLRPSGVSSTDMYNRDFGFIFYGLSLNNAGDPGSVGFYFRKANGIAFDFTEEGMAYLALPYTPTARPSIVFADEITGITNINAEKAAPAELYNIMGIRMQEAKGLVVREGKMQFVK